MDTKLVKTFQVDYDISYVPIYWSDELVGVQVNIIQRRIQIHGDIDYMDIYEEHIPIYSKVLD